jgi:hypothetical protein
MKIIGKNKSGIIVQIDYKEISELNGGLVLNEELNTEEMWRLFRDIWDDIKRHYKVFPRNYKQFKIMLKEVFPYCDK